MSIVGKKEAPFGYERWAARQGLRIVERMPVEPREVSLWKYSEDSYTVQLFQDKHAPAEGWNKKEVPLRDAKREDLVRFFQLAHPRWAMVANMKLNDRFMDNRGEVWMRGQPHASRGVFKATNEEQEHNLFAGRACFILV